MPRYSLQYACLILILSVAVWMRGTAAIELIRILRNPSAVPAEPFTLQTATRTIGSGVFFGDQILAVDGKPLHSVRHLEEIVASRHPGDSLVLTLSEPSGHAIERTVRIPSQADSPFLNLARFDRKLLSVCTSILIPLIGLALGAFVVAIRPRDPNAWILLFLLLAFSEMLGGTYGVPGTAATAWNLLWAGQWAPLMMIFGLRFPKRAAWDRKHPAWKLVLLLPCMAGELAFSAGLIVWNLDLNAAVRYRPLFLQLSFFQTITGMLAVSVFFWSVGFKAATAVSADVRRRLRILQAGTSVALAPMFLVVLYALVRGQDIFVGIPWPATFFSLLMLCLFPLALAYVIVVERAMDLTFVVRQGVRYGLARVGLWVARLALVAVGLYIFTVLERSPRTEEWVAVVGGLVILRRRTADRGSQWIDRKFFREAYDSEQVLTDLAGEVSHYIEIQPLLDKVAGIVSGTLHVPDLVILIREDELFIPRFSTRTGEPMPIPADSRIASELRGQKKPLTVYFDSPAAWIRSLDAQELQTLDFMRSQLLLPLFGSGRLSAIMSLGAKLSEVPYSATDIRLLQTVASQMGLALENSRLAASLAHAAAERERSNRELEIAREVQERLFPQSFPPFPGVDCAGYCRPARGVGGDYYDFLKLDDGRLGIAIGDVSGKGIAAALLMASLQASLRGQTMAGLHDLSALMQNVNRLVYEASTSNRYATFFYGEYDPVSHKLDFANAGHNPPVILRGGEVLRLEAGGPVVGLLPGVSFGHDMVQLRPGDVFVSFTDGISEALNEQEEEWEEDRFIAAARANCDFSAKDLIAAIFREADAFTGEAKQYDDMTLLVMKLIT